MTMRENYNVNALMVGFNEYDLHGSHIFLVVVQEKIDIPAYFFLFSFHEMKYWNRYP